MKWPRSKKKSSPKGSPRKKRRPFRQRALSALPVLFGSIVLTMLYSDTALFRKLETTALAFTMLSRAPADSSSVVIVAITEPDYQRQFGGKSPLDSGELRKVIEAIAAAGPRVIGVDIDTSSSGFQEFGLPPGLPPVIWARDASFSNVNQIYRLSSFLGQRDSSQPYGLVTLKLDGDGAIRRYVRWYEADIGPVPSLPWQMVQVFRTGQAAAIEANPSSEALFINYPGPARVKHFYQPSASQVIDLYKRGWAADNFLKGKMVLLGGDYAPHDEHDTPVGWMLGTQVLASIIETEMDGGGQKPVGIFTILFLVIFDSALLLLFVDILGLWKTLILSVVIVPALGFVCSYLVFGSATYVGYFMLVLTAVLLHQLYEKGKDYLKKLRQQTGEQLQ